MELLQRYKIRKTWSFADIHQIYIFKKCGIKVKCIAQYFAVSSYSIRKQLHKYKMIFHQYRYIFKYLGKLKINHFTLSMHYINQILFHTGYKLLSYFDWIYIHKLLFRSYINY